MASSNEGFMNLGLESRNFVKFYIRGEKLVDTLLYAGVLEIIDDFDEFRTARLDRKKCDPQRYDNWKDTQVDIIHQGLYAEDAPLRTFFEDVPLILNKEGDEITYYALHIGMLEKSYFISKIMKDKEIKVSIDSSMCQMFDGVLLKNGVYVRDITLPEWNS